MAERRFKLTGDALEFFRKAGAKGGKKRAQKYSSQQLSEWAMLGGRPRKVNKAKSRPAASTSSSLDRKEHFFSHGEIFPVIARIIEDMSGSSIKYVTHDRIVKTMLEHADARSALDNCPDHKPRAWWALDMVAFFGKTYTEGRSAWSYKFDRMKIDGKWAYRVGWLKRKRNAQKCVP